MKSSLKRTISLILAVVMITTTYNFNSFAVSLDNIIKNELDKIELKNKNSNIKTKYYEELLSEKKQLLMNDDKTTNNDKNNNDTTVANTTTNDDIDKTVENYINENNKNKQTTNENNITNTNKNDNGNQVNAEDENENITSNEDNTINNKTNDDTNKSTNNDENKNDVENNTNTNNNISSDTNINENENDIQVDVVEDDIIEDDIDNVVSDAIAITNASNVEKVDDKLNDESVKVELDTDAAIDDNTESQVFGVGVDNLQFKIGDFIKFGRYEQDNDLTNGKELIQWIIMNIDTNKQEAVLFPTKALDFAWWHTSNVSGLSYRNSSIRKFINNNFFNAAFNNEEKQYIIGRTDVCNDAQVDNAWLLSKDEWHYYATKSRHPSTFSPDVQQAILCHYGVSGADDKYPYQNVTPYAIQQAHNKYRYYSNTLLKNGYYYLRDTEMASAYFVDTYYDHRISKFYQGNYCCYVRPAITVKLELLNSQLINDYFKQFMIGDVIRFGNYEQGSGKQDIKWVVADIDKTTREGILVSIKTLEYVPFVDAEGKGPCSYNVSDIRKFLNNDFFNTAFTDEEKKNIISRTDICGDGSPDNVYILSSSEFTKYYNNRLQLLLGVKSYFVTSHALNRFKSKGYGYQEIPVVAEIYDGAYYLRDTGKIVKDNVTNLWDSIRCGVRPAIKVDLTSLGNYNNIDKGNVEYKINWQLDGGAFKDEYKHYETDKHNDTEDFILPTEDMLTAPYGKVFKEWLVEGVATTSIAKEIKKDVSVVAKWTKSSGGFESYYIGKYKLQTDAERDEILEWLILDKKDDKLLLMTKDVIDNVSYDTNGNTEFKNSSINKWLNKNFYENAFDDKQKRNILNNKNNGKVFLLTEEDYNEYFVTNLQSIAEATNYATNVKNGNETLELKGNLSPYWLMTHSNVSKVPYVSADGSLNKDGAVATAKTIGVRPCVWVEEKKMEEVKVYTLGELIREMRNDLIDSLLDWLFGRK